MGNRNSNRVNNIGICPREYHDLYSVNLNNDKLYLENLKYIIKQKNPELKYYIQNNIKFIWDTEYFNNNLIISNYNNKNDIDIVISNQISFKNFKPKFPDFFDNKECSICLENVNKISSGSQMPVCLHCDHVFHYKCIADWYKKNSSCPLCRNRISTEFISEEPENAIIELLDNV